MTCQPQLDNSKWFNAAISGDVGYLTENFALFQGQRENRKQEGLIIPGFAAIHYAVRYNQILLFQALLKWEYTMVTRQKVEIPISDKLKFILGAESTIAHLAVLLNRKEIMHNLLVFMQLQNNKELISLTNSFGYTASMIGTIVGGATGEMWFSLPQVQIIESTICDNEGTTLLMTAALYGRSLYIEKLKELLNNNEIIPLYKNRILKLVKAQTIEGWTAVDAALDDIDMEKYRTSKNNKMKCQLLISDLVTQVNNQSYIEGKNADRMMAFDLMKLPISAGRTITLMESQLTQKTEALQKNQQPHHTNLGKGGRAGNGSVEIPLDEQ